MPLQIKSPARRPDSHYAESEDSRWNSEETPLMDPRVIEPKMYTGDRQSGWGFYPRAELLNGRLAMLGFVIGMAIEAVTGHGILQQLGLGGLLPHL